MRSEQRDRVYKHIDAERIRQDEKHGGPEHDDTHSPEEWADIAHDRVERARDASERVDPDEWHRQTVTALAVLTASLEAFYRRFGV